MVTLQAILGSTGVSFAARRARIGDTMAHKGMKFGIFLAPFHRIGENPTLALSRDMELIEWLDYLGYDEVWVGEHHSAGWELIASPEIFMAGAAAPGAVHRAALSHRGRERHDPGRRGRRGPARPRRALAGRRAPRWT